MSSEGYQTYYVPEKSRLPICMAIGLAVTVFGVATMMNDMSAGVEDSSAHLIMFLGFLIIAATMYTWFAKVITENHGGLYSPQLNRSFVWGMGWFIFSEVMFFAAFFGALFYVRNFAVPWLGGEGDKGVSAMLWPEFQAAWPLMETPDGTKFPGPRAIIDPWHLPLINTLLLLSSSVTVHFAHTALKADNRQRLKMWLGITIALGLTFLVIQIIEYGEAYSHLGLTLNSGIYGSTFFMLTGFHGAHVTIGAFMLSVMLIRAFKGHFKPEEHFGFEAASWYWHFVDVVWVGLFIFVYIL
ncbi:MAG: cytochrome c oxidase subunit 3 [Pseudomonadales bacterium]|jgi:cytochrome c oxidase subunit 3